jgi:proteasome assembly chaperone (PAC2) family protein
MNDQLKLTHPWLVAVWPGMGHVALNAGAYLISKLNMTPIAEFEAPDLFDIDALEVQGGILQTARSPRNRFCVYRDPNGRHDLMVFFGEAQPPVGKAAFCRNLVAFAKQLGVEKAFTFAALATQMEPDDESRVFGVATNSENLEVLKRLELNILSDGHIGGLNGLLLGTAAEAGIHGACLLGEMPHIFAQLPFPRASHGILDAFTTMAGLDVNLEELAEQGRIMDEKLEKLLEQVEAANEGEDDEDEEFPMLDEAEEPPPAIEEPRPSKWIEELFAAAQGDRAKAVELKAELDRQHVFKQYEDRFLDLFRSAA